MFVVFGFSEAEEAISFAEANPRVDLGRETGTKVEVRSFGVPGLWLMVFAKGCRA